MSARLRVALTNAIALLTPAGAAAACGCTASDLHDAMAGRRGRKMPTEWTLAIADAVGGSLADEIFAALLEPFGRKAVPSVEPMPDAPYIQLLERTFVESFGTQGACELERVRRLAHR
jgi:hypothetical protein